MNLFTNTYVENRLKLREAAAVLSSSGGKARAEQLSSKQRSTIASNAAKARWERVKQASAC